MEGVFLNELFPRIQNQELGFAAYGDRNDYVIVDLTGGTEKRRVCGIEIVRVELTLVNVESNEHERPVVVFMVFTHVHALHSAHVSAKRE